MVHVNNFMNHSCMKFWLVHCMTGLLILIVCGALYEWPTCFIVCTFYLMHLCLVYCAYCLLLHFDQLVLSTHMHSVTALRGLGGNNMPLNQQALHTPTQYNMHTVVGCEKLHKIPLHS